MRTFYPAPASFRHRPFLQGRKPFFHHQPPHGHSRMRTLLRALAILAVVSLCLFLGTVWYLAASAPDIDTVSVSPTESATYICDQEGNRLRKLSFSESNRDIVSIQVIPQDLQHAVIAIEDARFYEHGGIDVRGIVRAVYNGITDRSFSEGASTITQQLIKNRVFTDWTQERTFFARLRRKIQEQYLAMQLEDRISKEEILEDYLNTINLGSGCYGVQSAALYYFGKNVSDLTLSESAVLAAIPQNPTGYDPSLHPEANRRRQMTVLRYMEAQGYLSSEERKTAETDPVYDRIRIQTGTEGSTGERVYSYYEDALISQVLQLLTGQLHYSKDQAEHLLYGGGLRIFSAQDPSLQKICDEEFANPANFPADTKFGIDYALSLADENDVPTHYSAEQLRSYVRQHFDPDFNLMCDSEDTARMYTDAFRKAMIDELQQTSEPARAASSSSLRMPPSVSGRVSFPADLLSGCRSVPASTRPVSADLSDGSLSNAHTFHVLAERLTLSPQPQASLVLMDQKTGLVKALVGGRGEKTASRTLNRASDTTRQPGSTFKILTAYAPALDAAGQTLATLYDNLPYAYEDGTPVSNWDITDYTGSTTIREAIVHSINVVAVRCITSVTPLLGFRYARRFGISTLHEQFESGGSRSSDLVQPLALGGITEGVTNLELCSAYAAIANGGIYRTPKFFTRIEDRNGRILFSFSDTEASSSPDSRVTDIPENAGSDLSLAESGLPSSVSGIDVFARDHTRILSESTSFLLTDAMRGVISDPSGTAYGLIFAAGQPVAGKTGTTSSYKDIWFAGYTPYYTCCTWGGYDNNRSLPDETGFHTYQKTLWTAVMNRVHETLPEADFPVPDTVHRVTLCSVSHLPANTTGCPDTYVEWFAEGTEPLTACPLHEASPQITVMPQTEPPSPSVTVFPTLPDQKLSEANQESGTMDPAKPEFQTNPPDTEDGSVSIPWTDSAPFGESSETDTSTEDFQETNSLDDLLDRLSVSLSAHKRRLSCSAKQAKSKRHAVRFAA